MNIFFVVHVFYTIQRIIYKRTWDIRYQRVIIIALNHVMMDEIYMQLVQFKIEVLQIQTWRINEAKQNITSKSRTRIYTGESQIRSHHDNKHLNYSPQDIYYRFKIKSTKRTKAWIIACSFMESNFKREVPTIYTKSGILL